MAAESWHSLILRHSLRAAVVFTVFAARIAAPYCWDTSLYVPILSPVYRQQEHWRGSASTSAAIAVHVSLGICMLLSIVVKTAHD